MLNSQLGAYIHEQLSNFTHRQLATLSFFDYVTDRTSSDVDRWRVLRAKGWQRMTEAERQEWLGEIKTTPSASKGMYTHRDLNRVECAVETLKIRFEEYGYDMSNIVVKTNWTYRDAFTKEDMVRYLGNISILRNILPIYPDTPDVPKIDEEFNFKSANDIEKILMDVDMLFTDVRDSRYHLGDLFAGEV